MESNVECTICFELVTKETVKCKNKSCKTILCVDCTTEYFKVNLTDNKIPLCPNQKCNEYYLFSDIKHIEELQQIYAKCCFNQLVVKHGDKAKKNVEIVNNIENLRRVRGVFIEEKFPLAIGYTATMIMPQKLRKLDKQLSDKMKNQTLNAKRTCMNLICSGFLDEDFVCLSCGAEFCDKCEKIKGKKHKCKNEDVESVSSIKEMIHCPECHLPIIKSQGCNNMTCANCGSNFKYDTGESGGSGAHGVSKIDAPKKKRSLLQLYPDNKYSCYFSQIEALEPKTTSDKTFTNILEAFYKNSNESNSSSLKIKLAMVFETHIILLYTNKRFHEAINNLEREINNNTLNKKYIKQLITLLKSPIF